MADARFLKHIEYIRKTYKPKRMEITKVVLEEMKVHLQAIGNLKFDSMPRSREVVEYLDLLCRRSLDLLQAENYDKLFDKIIDLHTAKNAGYAGIGTSDAWANFRTAEWFHVDAFTGCLVRMGDKFIRVSNLSKNPDCDQVGESIKDTLYDFAIYCVIAICLWEEMPDSIMCDGGIRG